MIHQLLTLRRPLIVLDTETTGLNTQEAHIVEIGFQMWDATGKRKEWRSLVDPGVSIPEGSAKVHGITDAVLRNCNRCTLAEADHPTASCPDFRKVPSFAALAPNLAKGFTDVDWAGKNIRYDLRILAAEFARAGVAWSYLGARIVDADRLEQIGEPRTLSHLYEKHTGRKLEGAHGALADADAARAVIEAQLKRYATALPRDLDALHELQFPGQIDPEGKFRFVDGVPTCTFGKWAGKPMAKIEPGYYDWIVSSDFSEDVKALARAAKLGEYPVRK